MEEQHSDYHNANSFTQNELDQSTSTNTLVRGNIPQKPLKPVVEHYLKALIKITRQETKAGNSNKKKKCKVNSPGVCNKTANEKTNNNYSTNF